METLHILSDEQLSSLISPQRQEIFACLRALGEGAATDIASHLGKSLESICFHLRALAKVGLIEVASIRPTGKRPSVVYRPKFQQSILPKAQESESLVRKSVMAGFRHTAREYEAASMKSVESPEIRSAIQVLRGQVRLNEADLKIMMQMFEQAIQYAKDHRDSHGILCSITSLCCPIVKSSAVTIKANPSSSQ